MYKIAPLFFLIALLPLQGEQNQALQKLQEQEMQTAASSHSDSRMSEVLMITPKQRAQDIKALFDFLQQRQETGSLHISLHKGDPIDKIINVHPLPGGTLILFTQNTTNGEVTKAVPIEQIQSITIQ